MGSVTAKLSAGCPTPECFALRALLPEGVAEHVKEIVRIGGGKACYELITVLDELRLAIMDVSIQCDRSSLNASGAVWCDRRHGCPDSPSAFGCRLVPATSGNRMFRGKHWVVVLGCRPDDSHPAPQYRCCKHHNAAARSALRLSQPVRNADRNAL